MVIVMTIKASCLFMQFLYIYSNNLALFKSYRSYSTFILLGNHSKRPGPRPFDKYLAIKVSTLLAMNNMVAKTKTQALNLMHYSLSLFLE